AASALVVRFVVAGRLLSLWRSSGAWRPRQSFPTRRSSELPPPTDPRLANTPMTWQETLSSLIRSPSGLSLEGKISSRTVGPMMQDRKSTRLNSSHVKISYAVFCVKKKKANIGDDLDRRAAS